MAHSSPLLDPVDLINHRYVLFVAQMILASAVMVLAGAGHDHVEATFNIYTGSLCVGTATNVKIADECQLVSQLGNMYYKLKSCTVRV